MTGKRLHVETCLRKERPGQTSLVLANTVGWSVATPGNFCSFSHYSETVFSAIKLTRNCYINMNISFLKTGNLIKN